MSLKTVEKDLKYIHENWVHEDVRKSSVPQGEVPTPLRAGRASGAAVLLRSRQDATEITTQYVPRRCRDCKGTGTIGTAPANGSKAKPKACPACKGEGTVTVEVVTKKVKGQAGDSSFLARTNQSMK